MYPVSDHYDGSRFFNPLNPEGNSVWAGAKMLWTSKFEEWPASVENSPALDLDRKLAPDEVAITFVNHATVLVQTRGFSFLTDPVWSERVSPLTWVGPKRHRPPGVPFDRLPKIDFVVISHSHYDHMDVSTLKNLDDAFGSRFLVPLGNKAFLESKGIANVVELDWWQSLELNPRLKISLAPAEHFSGRSPFDRNETLWGSYVVSFDGHAVFFGGDTAYSPHFKAIRERFGSPDIALLPIGAYEPRWFMKSVHMNPEEAVLAHLDLGAERSIGVHFGTFQLTPESIDQPLKDLDEALKKRNLAKDEFVTLPEGRTQVLNLARERHIKVDP
jgi:L-ascorbate metabolism protein UlaG (beta-lactamase superfamily)